MAGLFGPKDQTATLAFRQYASLNFYCITGHKDYLSTVTNNIGNTIWFLLQTPSNIMYATNTPASFNDIYPTSSLMETSLNESSFGYELTP